METKVKSLNGCYNVVTEWMLRQYTLMEAEALPPNGGYGEVTKWKQKQMEVMAWSLKEC